MLSNPIAVIGGAGKSGSFLVRELLQQNIPFRLLLRQASGHSFPNNEIILGDARDPDTIQRLCAGCQAVISTLGQSRGEPPIFSPATRNVLQAMKQGNIQRYIVTTGLNVDTPEDKKGPITQAGTQWMRQHYPETTADKQREYELLRASAVDWTLVRLPLIGLTNETSDIATSLEDCPGQGIHAKDLARFLVEQLTDTRYIRQAPFLANRPAIKVKDIS